MSHQWRKVTEAKLEHGGKSIFPPYVPLGSVWELALECGHKVNRPVRYNKDDTPFLGRKGRASWWRRRSPADALPAPKKVRCEVCELKEKK